MLPVASGRFLHLVVLYVYQGAGTDAEQLADAEQLFYAALGELEVVALDQPCLIVGGFNVEPTKIPCLAKGISAGLWVDLESAWAFASGKQPGVTCKRTWGPAGGHRRDFMVGCPFVAAAVASCSVQQDRWIVPHLAVRTYCECARWTCKVAQPGGRTPLWPASWLPGVDRSRGSKSAEIQRSGRFMMTCHNVWPGLMLPLWMSHWMPVMFLVLGLCGLLLWRLLLLTLIEGPCNE